MIGEGSQATTGLKEGVIVDIDKTSNAIAKAVEQAATKAGINIKEVVVGLPANYLRLNEVHGMISLNVEQGQSREITDQDVIDVARATMDRMTPADQEPIDLVLKDFAVDRFTGIKDPRGMVGVRLEMWGTLYSGLKTVVHNARKAVEQAGLNIQDFVIAPIATGFNLLNDGEQDFGTLMVDLGGGQTTTSIILDHQLKFAFVDPEGGQYITHDIAEVLNTTQSHAERLKRDHGYAKSELASDDVQVPVEVVGKNQPVNVSEKYLAEIIEARMRQIFGRAKQQLDSIQAPNLPGGLVLTGGVAALPGTKELAQEYFDTNVKIFVPDQMGIRHPGYSLVLALCRYENNLSEVERLIKQVLNQGSLIQSPHQYAQRHNQVQPQYTSPVAPTPAPATRPASPATPVEPTPRRTDNAGSIWDRIRAFFKDFFE
ncbi:Cell division protein FtsA [Limosilactobacillus equigenerosi DSM 18793 = JCM 14505]|uniref:Cell division protein FtsA n=1 Tax=Limosilactobacillus equigenerosi DSM 18793 = JCM 14505 TaxID=1423742 RepID=A0A0R1UT99_9LACO|nr:Cell division protein FtsA [Limosilactobacillus equigenerosi DSM 18793 = JCM 14505]